VSSGPQLVPSAARPAEPQERTWLPLIVAAAVVLVVGGLAVLLLEHGKPKTTVTPISAVADPYAASLPLTGLTMSESANLAGGKVTYLDGHIANTGGQTVTGVTVQVLFRNGAHEVAQNETQPLKLVRMREPYIDLEPISAAPLAPGAGADFRLIFDAVSPDWDGAFPEVRVLRVETK
jgi:hypothetical protein